MLFKPNFCCGCGEKIQRAEWGILTSRRFCDVCAVENQGHEWLPRVVVLSAVLIGLFGFGSYLRSGESVSPITLKQAGNLRKAPVSEAALKPARQERSTESPAAGADGITGGDREPSLSSNPLGSSKEQPRLESVASDEPVYFCGAMTKKGKPCSRRVKSKGRCWQHVGQPSALASRTATDVY